MILLVPFEIRVAQFALEILHTTKSAATVFCISSLHDRVIINYHDEILQGPSSRSLRRLDGFEHYRQSAEYCIRPDLEPVSLGLLK